MTESRNRRLGPRRHQRHPMPLAALASQTPSWSEIGQQHRTWVSENNQPIVMEGACRLWVLNPPSRHWPEAQIRAFRMRQPFDE